MWLLRDEFLRKGEVAVSSTGVGFLYPRTQDITQPSQYLPFQEQVKCYNRRQEFSQLLKIFFTWDQSLQSERSEQLGELLGKKASVRNFLHKGKRFVYLSSLQVDIFIIRLKYEDKFVIHLDPLNLFGLQPPSRVSCNRTQFSLLQKSKLGTQ